MSLFADAIEKATHLLLQFKEEEFFSYELFRKELIIMPLGLFFKPTCVFEDSSNFVIKKFYDYLCCALNSDGVTPTFLLKY